MRKIHYTLVAMLLVLSACSEGGDGGLLVEPEGPTLTAAWEAYESGRYATAKADFGALTVRSPRSSAAWMGLGWSQLRLREFGNAVISLDRALQENGTQSDGNAGRAFAFFERSPQNHGEAIGAANMALRLINASWVFSHNAEVNWRDLRLIMARCHFALGEYSDADEQIVRVGGTSVPPDEMQAEIDRLVGLFGGDSGGGQREYEPPPGSVAVNLRVVHADQTITPASGLCMKGQFDVDAARRVVSEDPDWKAPWPRLFDDGPWTDGGHEPADAAAGDGTWGVTVFVAPLAAAQQFEYGLVLGAQSNPDGFTGGVAGAADSGETWVWPQPGNGFFAVAPLGGADIDLPLVTLQASTAAR